MSEEATGRVLEDDEALYSKPKVRHRYGVSDTSLARWRTDPDVRFPGPDLCIKGREYWWLGTLRGFEKERGRNTS
jgi:hypothetical protein